MKQTTGAFHLSRAAVSKQVLCLISSLNAPDFSRTRPWGDVSLLYTSCQKQDNLL